MPPFIARHVSLAALVPLSAAALLGACGSSSTAAAPTTSPGAETNDAGPESPTSPTNDAGREAPTLRSDVTAVTKASDAQPGAFIPPFVSCQAPVAGDTTTSADGKVCTNVAIAGSTEAGKYFPSYAACDVVRTERPYYPAPPHAASSASDPRLKDAKFMTELAWVTEQVRASACTCCHDASQAPKGASQWDVTAKPIWTDTASDSAIALFSGLADSSIFGHYEPKDDNGFERTTTGVPSTDAARMQAFWYAELARRNITQAQAAAIPPFGGSLYTSLHAKPATCPDGIGVDAQGKITWGGAAIRYVFILDPSAPNPDLPPAADPAGTLWRLDVLASADALHSGITYGTTPKGSFQAKPVEGFAPTLAAGQTYHLFTFIDMGLVGQNCLFTVPSSP